MATSQSALFGSAGLGCGIPISCHQWETLPLIISIVLCVGRVLRFPGQRIVCGNSPLPNAVSRGVSSQQSSRFPPRNHQSFLTHSEREPAPPASTLASPTTLQPLLI